MTDIGTYFEGYNSKNSRKEFDNQVEKTTHSLDKVNSGEWPYSQMVPVLSGKQNNCAEDSYGLLRFSYGLVKGSQLLPPRTGGQEVDYNNGFWVFSNTASNVEKRIQEIMEQGVLRVNTLGSIERFSPQEIANVKTSKKGILLAAKETGDNSFSFLPMDPQKITHLNLRYLHGVDGEFPKGGWLLNKGTKQVMNANNQGIGFAMPMGNFIKQFYHVEKITFSSLSGFPEQAVINHIGEFKKATQFSLRDKTGPLGSLLKNMQLPQNAKKFQELNITSLYKLSPFDDGNAYVWPIRWCNRLKVVCEHSKDVVKYLNLAGWWISKDEIIAIIQPLVNLKVFVIGMDGYKDTQDGKAVFTSQEINEIKNALPQNCQLVVVNLDPVGCQDCQELNPQLFDKENRSIKK